MTDRKSIIVFALNVVVLAIVGLAEVGAVPTTLPVALPLLAVAFGSLVWVAWRAAPLGMGLS
jgi:hypothetical protein